MGGCCGSGKSTLLRMLAGVSLPSTGRVTGRPRTGYVPERFPPGLPFTAHDYLAHLGRVHGLRGRALAAGVIRRRRAERLAGGGRSSLPATGRPASPASAASAGSCTTARSPCPPAPPRPVPGPAGPVPASAAPAGAAGCGPDRVAVIGLSGADPELPTVLARMPGVRFVRAEAGRLEVGADPAASDDVLRAALGHPGVHVRAVREDGGEAP